MGKLIEEKALEHRGFSLEEKVSEFLDNDFAESDAAAFNPTEGYGSESDGNESNDPIIQHTLYWESQEALLQVYYFHFNLLLLQPPLQYKLIMQKNSFFFFLYIFCFLRFRTDIF